MPWTESVILMEEVVLQSLRNVPSVQLEGEEHQADARTGLPIQPTDHLSPPAPSTPRSGPVGAVLVRIDGCVVSRVAAAGEHPPSQLLGLLGAGEVVGREEAAPAEHDRLGVNGIVRGLLHYATRSGLQ